MPRYERVEWIERKSGWETAVNTDDDVFASLNMVLLVHDLHVTPFLDGCINNEMMLMKRTHRDLQLFMYTKEDVNR